VPVLVDCHPGNTNDSTTHGATWDALVRLAGQPDFLYIADGKLCSHETMDHIHRHGGRFLTVLPRSRGEDGHFRRWIHTHVPTWEVVRDRPNPRGRRRPRDVWRVWRSDFPSAEGWPITWVSSSLLARKQANTRREHLERAGQELDALNATLASPRCRLKRRREVYDRLKEILTRYEVTRYLRLKVETHEVHRFRQFRAGRPGPKTAYRRITRKHFAIVWRVHEDAIARDQKHDGMYPLITNDASLSPADVLRRAKAQPRLENRFRQMKDAFEIAPVFLKNEARIEALFFLYALALLVQALIEREIRRAMEKEQIASLPIYPEERPSRFPTAPQIFRLFAHLERHVIRAEGEPVQQIPPVLTDIQKRVLRLLGVPLTAYGRAC
jgi:transposase